MFPGFHAQQNPSSIAYVMASTGEEVSYRELEDKSNQGAQIFRALGLNTGDHIAIMMENHPMLFQICWAAQRSGLYYTVISYNLQKEEVAYIVKNSGAKLFVTSDSLKELAGSLRSEISDVEHCFMIGADLQGYNRWETSISEYSKEKWHP